MALVPTAHIKTIDDARRAIQKLASNILGPNASPTFYGLTLTTPLLVPSGGTGLATLTDHGLLLGSGTGAITPLAEATDGQIPIGDTDGDPILATLTGTVNQVNIANAAGSITLSTPQDIDATATPTFAGLISTDVIQATDFAKTGWPTVPGVTLSFVGGTTRTFTVTDDDSAYYYIDGVKYTLGGNKTVIITDTEGLWYIYFDGATLTASQTTWSFVDEDKALVAVLYWARDVGTPANGKEIFLGWEAHTFYMDGTTHARLHYAGGARWETGLLVSDAGSEDVNISAGDIWDEDLNIPITDEGGGLFSQVLSPAQLPIYYRDGASTWRKYETNEKAATTDVGYLTGGLLQYNDPTTTWSNEEVELNNYVAYYVVATNDQTEPIALIMGQRVDNKLSDAKINNVFSGLSLTGLPFEEMVVLARLILKDTATYTLEEVLDLRAYNIKGNITSPLITQHAGLGGLDFASAGHSGFQAQGDVLDDLNTLGVNAADSEFLVGTAIGALAWESGATVRTSIGLGTGDSPTFAGLTITNCCVLGSNSAVFQPNADAVTFFQILDADGGTSIFNVDTTNERVGIGTTAPNAPLEVKGAKPGVVGGHQSGQLQVTGTGGEFYCAVITGHNSFNGNTQLWYLGNTSSSSHNDIAFINRQNAPIHFYTNNTSRMTIDAAGNVTLTTIAAEATDVDKFLVDSSGVIKYRTGAQVLSDIGGGITAAELEELSDGSETTLHSHAGGAADPTSAISVYISADQTINDETLTTVAFNTEDYDLDTEFNTTTHIFKCKTAGYYACTGFVTFDIADAGALVTVYLVLNGAAVAQMNSEMIGATNWNTLFAHKDLYLAVDDEVKIQVYQNSDGNYPIKGGAPGQKTYMTIHKISG